VETHYQRHTQVHWTSYSSTTTNIETAAGFAGVNGVIMKISVFTGKAVKDYSAFPDEQEVLLSPNMDLVVVTDIYSHQQYNQVDLTQTKPGPKFVF